MLILHALADEKIFSYLDQLIYSSFPREKKDTQRTERVSFSPSITVDQKFVHRKPHHQLLCLRNQNQEMDHMAEVKEEDLQRNY